MNVEDTIRYTLMAWPYIETNRLTVLNQLFLTIGNGYEWEDGELVEPVRGGEITPEDIPTTEEAVKLVVQDTLIDQDPAQWCSLWELMEKDPEKMLRDKFKYYAEVITGQIELIYRIEERMQDMSVPDKKRYPYSFITDKSVPSRLNTVFYPICEYSDICNLPDDIKPDWLREARRMYDFIIGHPELVPDCYKPDFDKWLPKVYERLKQLEGPKWLYRLEAASPDNGLWYNSNNEYVWGCRDCKGNAKNLPMGYVTPDTTLTGKTGSRHAQIRRIFCTGTRKKTQNGYWNMGLSSRDTWPVITMNSTKRPYFLKRLQPNVK